MELPIEEFQYQFDTSTKCKTSGEISGYEILKEYDNCNYYIKININNIVYYTDTFHNNKNCTFENNTKLLDELYPKGKEVEVIVNAEQDYVFLADKDTKYIKYESNEIGTCTNNNIKETKQEPEKVQPINTTQNYYLFGVIVFILIVIALGLKKLYFSK